MSNYKKHLKSYPNTRLPLSPLQQWLNTSLLIVIAVMLIMLVIAIALLVVPEPVFLLVVVCAFLLGVVTGGGMQAYWISLQVTQVLKILHELTTNFLRLPVERYHFPITGLPLNTVAVLFQLEESSPNSEYTVSLSEGEYRHFVQSNGLAISFCSSIEQAYRTSSLSRALLAARMCLPLSHSGSGTAQQQVFVVRHNRSSQPANVSAQSIEPPHSTSASTDNSAYTSMPSFTVQPDSPSSPSAVSQPLAAGNSPNGSIDYSVNLSSADSSPPPVTGSDISSNSAYNQVNIDKNNPSAASDATDPIESAPTLNLTGSHSPHPKVILFSHIRPDDA